MRLSFGTLRREYINQIEMIQYRVVRYIFNDYNLRRNPRADESKCDTSMTSLWRIFSRDQSECRIADTPSLTSLQKLQSVASLKEQVPVLNRMECEGSGNEMSRLMTKPTMWLCAQRRLRSAWASALSDQSLRCPHDDSLGPWLPIKRMARLGGWPGWSESLLGAQLFCWFCHEAAQMLV